ncbi:hypothetical protein [Longimicrobium sp.]|jgi:hypothetical protein|uniref:hypothetical protein n=1 Tax=Longimicrobium sp. TaxID=2029185 RepID=UPI002ED803F0
MMITRRIAAPALALLVTLGASGCAGLSLSNGCGMNAMDPMADGASRLNVSATRHQQIGQMQAYQKKAMIANTQFSNQIRKPGQVTVAPASQRFCY